MSLGTLLIRADASPEIGTGHVMRCLALAQAWQASGGSAMFLMAQSTPAVRARLAAEDCSVLSVSMLPGSLQDSTQTCEFAHRYDADWVLTDGYNFDANYHEAIRRDGHQLLCVDDSGELEYYGADIVVNQNLNAAENWYRRRAIHTQLLLGPRFCLLRREFAPWRGWLREIPSSPRTGLLTLGGTPSAQISTRTMESLSRLSIDGFHTVFALGASSLDIAPIESCAAGFAGKITIRKDVRDMAALMAAADIAVSGAGSTCWELCFLALPSVLLDVCSNQTPVAQELDRQGCAVYLGKANEVEPAELANAIEVLLMSQNIRESLSRRCRQLIDGLGTARVVSAMQSLRRPRTISQIRGAPA
jgi:UDP-2,4-diacetamido-2,4,6-trideoxy-beta-L-altropyranose hydrolase